MEVTDSRPRPVGEPDLGQIWTQLPEEDVSYFEGQPIALVVRTRPGNESSGSRLDRLKAKAEGSPLGLDIHGRDHSTELQFGHASTSRSMSRTRAIRASRSASIASSERGGWYL